MAIQQVSFDRPFQIWIYTVGHGQLLLRSNRSNEYSTRVDILFKDVAALQLPTVFDGLVIDLASKDEAARLNVQLGSMVHSRHRTFIVRGTTFAGYVIAGAVFWHEDEGDHHDESFFQKSFLRPI
jgi:hypothetical protein